MSLLCLVVLLLSLPLSAQSKNALNVAYFSQDPPAIASLSPSFDPDSYAVITQIFDSLVHFDLDGNIQSALAISWQRESPLRWRFKLRKGAYFHNGEPFDAKAVKFTYDFVLNAKNNTGNRWILSSIKQVELVEDDLYQVIIETHFPDNMLLNRLNMFGGICPPQYIKQHGLEYFLQNPVGTGPFRFEQWQKGKAIELTRNPQYWRQDIPFYDTVRFKVIPQSRWLDAIKKGEVDLVPNFPGNKTIELMQHSGKDFKLVKRLVLAGYWVLLHNEGIFADLNVRKALNHAVNKDDLVKFGDFGNAVPLASLGKKHEFGANSDLIPYAYDLQKAKKLLQAADIAEGHTLTMLAADVAEPVARIIQSNLQDVGFDVKLDVVSRSEWATDVIAHKLKTGQRSRYDLVVNMVDNPIFHLGFHAGLFLDSRSPWSQINDPKFNQLFDRSMSEVEPHKAEMALQQLDKYIHDNAMMLFTTQRILTVAVSKKTDIDTFGLNGHLDYELLSTAKQVQHD